ncbi:hypothetical protein KHC23_00515 [Ancylobacter dichloromethanicus]|uniref:Cytochrome c family protein n=1 Tax=Ancylobacter dichloromethanicus TaxID=518825 RepID=A0A9W6JD85_9HYPH|nr:hypothetical protein [Ancylobacter dichloromethanicus]MBS7552141.1 hypothetical protein [Ancylobacter dichloromethanicus]GLK73874.1 hypothetical protein GCM10017643_39920 [Ancylobacter dichloromethanicus]
MRAISMLCLAGAVGLTTAAAQYAYSQSPYVPAAVFCADGGTAPCSIIPAYIGPDPDLDHSIGYTAIVGGLPTSSETDPQTPFDNMSWQSFVGLNWIAGTESAPAEKGLAATGLRVWQTWAKVNRVFGNAPVQAACANPSNLPVISIGSDGGGNPSQKNDDYYQASTNVPLIDINGNWTLFERRLNVTEIAYLAAPGGNPFNTLLTVTGQNNFVAAGDSVAFTASSTDPRGTRGAMELKIAWRLLGTDDDAGRYITQKVLLTVAPDLVIGTQPICATVTVGMVGMHIIQRNPDYATNIALEPEWIWSTFEHVDNAPLAETACDLTNPQACTTLNKPSCGGAASGAAAGSYFVPLASPVAVATNVPPTPSTTGPAFVWNPIQPYAKDYTQPVSVNGRTFYLGPQVVRCWQVYTLTDQLNAQWQAALATTGSPLAHYKLVGTQWGAIGVDGALPPYPSDAVPGLLSNTTLETYIQNNTEPTASGGPGSCVACHRGATLVDGTTPSDFSFLPGLASPSPARLEFAK